MAIERNVPQSVAGRGQVSNDVIGHRHRIVAAAFVDRQVARRNIERGLFKRRRGIGIGQPQRGGGRAIERDSIARRRIRQIKGHVAGANRGDQRRQIGERNLWRAGRTEQNIAAAGAGVGHRVGRRLAVKVAALQRHRVAGAGTAVVVDLQARRDDGRIERQVIGATVGVVNNGVGRESCQRQGNGHGRARTAAEARHERAAGEREHQLSAPIDAHAEVVSVGLASDDQIAATIDAHGRVSDIGHVHSQNLIRDVDSVGGRDGDRVGIAAARGAVSVLKIRR